MCQVYVGNCYPKLSTQSQSVKDELEGPRLKPNGESSWWFQHDIRVGQTSSPTERPKFFSSKAAKSATPKQNPPKLSSQNSSQSQLRHQEKEGSITPINSLSHKKNTNQQKLKAFSHQKINKNSHVKSKNWFVLFGKKYFPTHHQTNFPPQKKRTP